MKLSEEYLLKQIRGSYAVIPAGQSVINKKNPIVINEIVFIILRAMKEEISKEGLLKNLIKELYVSTEEEAEFTDLVEGVVEQFVKEGVIA